MATPKTQVIDLDREVAGAVRHLWFAIEDDEEAGVEMVATAKAIEASQQTRQDQMLRQARLFTNQWLSSLYDLATARMDRRVGPWNLCAAAVSTAQSMVCRSEVNVTLETSGAEHSTQRLARDATRWFYGVLAENKVGTEVAPTCFGDAGIVDAGAAVVRVVKKRIVIERVFPAELIVSDVESINGPPFQIFVKKYLPKHSVMLKYGKDPANLEAIKGVACEAPADGMGYQAQLIPVYEGWSVQGKHIVAVKGKKLEAEDWPCDFLPVVPMYIDRPIAGWYGRGYVQQLMGYQIQLLQINDAIDEHIRLLASAKWCVESGSGIDPADLDNEIASILIKNRGAPDPKVLVGPVVPEDLFEERQRTFDQGLLDIGLNSWSVKGQEPADRSGFAMEVARDKERGRLLTAGNNYEQWFVELAQVCFALGHKTAGTPYPGRGPGDKDLRAVDFKEIASFLKEKPWRVRLFPISALPESPNEKRKVIDAWFESGFITGPTAISLLELPDVDAEASLVSAAREDIMWSIEEILERGRDGYRSPEAFQDLKLGSRMFVSAWLKARRQGVEESKLDLLQKWVNEAQALVKPPSTVDVEQRPGVGLAPAAAEPVNLEGGAAPVPALPAAPSEALPPEAALPQGELPPVG